MRLIFLASFILSAICGSAFAKPDIKMQIVDPIEILPYVHNGKYERGGIPLFREDANEWVRRLKKSQLKVEFVFLKISPFMNEPNIVNALICFNRKIQKPEYSFWWNSEYAISDDLKVSFSSGKKTLFTHEGEPNIVSRQVERFKNSKFKYRCFETGYRTLPQSQLFTLPQRNRT